MTKENQEQIITKDCTTVIHFNNAYFPDGLSYNEDTGIFLIEQHLQFRFNVVLHIHDDGQDERTTYLRCEKNGVCIHGIDIPDSGNFKSLYHYVGWNYADQGDQLIFTVYRKKHHNDVKSVYTIEDSTIMFQVMVPE